MLKNYFKIALRTIRRHKGYTFINVFGLAVGMAACLLIGLYVSDELSYDRFHENANHIYRVVQEQRFNSVQQVAVMSSPVAPALLASFPEIKHAIRFYRSNNLMRRGEEQASEVSIAFVDSTVFDVFTFSMLQGNPNLALHAPNTIVLTESSALKFFGQDDPLGEIVRFEDRELRVTGVMADVPSNSHFNVEALASYSSLAEEPWIDSWGRNSVWTYVLLRPGASPQALETKLPSFIEDHIERGDALDVFSYFLQPLTDIHLHSHMISEFGMNSDITTVYIFSAIALFILLIASINYINLATACSAQRLREVGMRKVLGASQGQLLRQLLGESFLLTFMALVGAVLLAETCLPIFNTLLGVHLSLNITTLIGLSGFFMIVGLLAGAYPALHLSRFRPALVLKGTLPGLRGGTTFRKALVVVQFTISIALIAAVGVAYQQLRFVQSKHLGFDKEHLISFDVQSDVARTTLLKDVLVQQPQVISATASRQPLGEGLPTTTFRREGSPEEDMLMVSYLDIDLDFIETMGMNLVAGRTFSNDIASDMPEAVVINEAAVRAFGWASPEEAIGKHITQGWTPEVIGVVRDFHFASLHQSIEPLLLWWEPPEWRTVTVRIRPGNVPATLAALEASWKQVMPGQPFVYTFVDEHLNALYRSDKILGELFGVFAALAIFIACLGLFGLATFTAEQRTKEIGIRKVLGASVGHLVALLSKDFVKLVGVAFFIAAPVAFFAMQRWLEDFAYRIDLSVWVFLVAGGAALLIALLTVSYQAIRAALADPVKSLRYE